MKKIVLLVGTLMAAALSGCSTVAPAKHFGETKLDSLKSAYVVAPSGNPNIGSYIVVALGHHGIRTTIGPLKDKPADVAFYVNYREHWNWDVAVYLDTLDVEFIDNENGKMIASGSFRNSKILESWPNPREKTIEVVDSIFASKP